jgi:threonine dehydrogenase-like Zn-dependent dehydrogenase
MKILKTMKKLSVLFVAALALGMSFVSCDKDDDKDAAIEGKWYFSKIAYTIGTDATTETDFPNACSTKKDFIELKTGGVSIDGTYDENCVLDQDTSTWSKSGNTLVLGGVKFEILSLTDTTIKVKHSYTQEGQTDYVVITLTR